MSADQVTAANTGFDPAVIETLENVIAPGRRTRLSPFVESAQFEVLFGKWPDDAKRAESSRSIIQGNQHEIDHLAERWSKFEGDGKQFSAEDYEDHRFLDLYLASYFSVNVPKVQIVLLDLLRSGKLQGTLDVLDVGVGTGATAVALLDFLLALGNACDLHGVTFPVDALRLHGIDRSVECLDYARSVVETYARALERRIVNRAAPSAVDLGEEVDVLDRVHSWAISATWNTHDLSQNSPAITPAPNLIFVSNALNEMRRDASGALGHLESYLGELAGGTIAVVIEPGDEDLANELMAWRRAFVNRGTGYESIGPCGQEFGNVLPDQCDNCWMARRENFHRTPLYVGFQQLANVDKPKKYKDFENDLLSWSYVILEKHAAHALTSASIPCNSTADGFKAVADQIPFRYMGTYWESKPSNRDPDDFSARTDGKPFAEYIKTCPVKSGATAAALERQTGFEFAPMRFGDQFYATNLVRRQRPGDHVTLHPAANGSTEVVPLAPITRGGDFLRSYGYRQRSAVDELAYRLFGFAGLRDFQHEILRRVLTGKNVLGIAATGGGKSECFILPAMVMQGVTIVVSPLRSLMTDQYEQRLKDRYGLQHLATFINGEVPFQERQARLKRMELGYYKLVYFTPEQLERGWVLDFLARTDSKVGIRYLALDEAHCISHWGHDFRPSYLNILHRLTQRGINPKRIALTATASPHVRDDICKELMLDADDVFVHSSNRPEINLVVRVRDTAAEKGEEILSELRKLKRHNDNNISPGAAIVFMPHTGKSPEMTQDYQGNENTTKGLTSSGATWFASYLERMLDQRVAIYHGEMDDQVSWESASPIVNGLPEVESTTATGHGRQLGDLSGRTRKQEQIAFINGDRNIMVATKGFGMGIDKPNVRLVIHRTPTSNLESYAQEAGRAGRDGEPATAMLFYAPPAKNPSQYQRQELSDNSDTFQERSDYDIQAFFVNRPYVRQCDVEVMRAFLMQVERRTTWVAATGAPASSIYFTNDEAIEFFDRCERDPAVYGFSWPKFEERLSRGRESPEHSAVLDRGHNYNEKTGYIGRILGVVNRIRPDIPGLQARLTLLQSFQQTGAHLLNLNLQALNWLGIIGSNSYFGDMLRDRGLSRDEFVAFIGGPDILPLASRLSMSIRDTAALLEDIKHSGEQLHNSWRRDLLNYSWLEAPFYGPATGLGHLSQWRDYAGATTRATKTQALLQANKRGWSNTKLTDDDWFGWKHVSKRVGWEVEPGSALEDDSLWQPFLAEFMRLHNQRKENDWASYHRLLTRYIGVREDGHMVDESSTECLRATLLGYLKSGEVVVGGNCKSCSRCDPKELFAATIVERLSVVQKLAADVAGMLDRLEDHHASSLPPLNVVESLLVRVSQEEHSGYSAVAYLGGWLNRILDESPDHRGALVVGLQASLHPDSRLPKLTPLELTGSLSRIAELSWSSRTESVNAWEVLSAAPENLHVDPLFVEAQALVLHGAGELAVLEEQSWLSFLRLLEPDTTGDRIIRAYECLLQLYAAEGKRADHGRYAEFQTWYCALSLAIGAAPWSEVNFVEAVRKLIANSVTPEQLIFIRDRVLAGGSNLDIPAVYIFRAQVARTLNEPEREAEAFEGYIRSGRIRGLEPRKLRLALEHLAQLLERYAPGEPQSDASVHEKILLRFASLQRTTDDAALVYAGIASTWNPERLQSEIAALLERKNAASVLGLLTAVDNLSLVKVVTTLDSKTLDAIQSVDLADARDYLSRVGTEPFQAMPLLASRLAEQLLSDWNASEADLILGVELSARAVQAGLPPKLIAKLMSSMVRREAHRPSVVLRALRAYGPMGKKISAGVYLELRPLRDADWMEWFLTFPSTGLVSRNRRVAETILADFIEHGSMSLSENAEAFVWTQIEVLERDLSEATTAVE